MSEYLPTVIEAPAEVSITPWYKKKRIEVVPTDIFEYEINKMITYKIIPHTTATNSNERLWRSIHKMYEMYENAGNRLDRERFKFRLREKDYFWFDIVFRQVKDRKQIEFYVTTSEFQSEKLKKRIESEMDVTISLADSSKICVPEENTVVQEMKYLRHDIFSLSTNKSEKQTPIGSIVRAVDDLNYDGDFARISICNEVESRQKWLKSAHWANEKLKKDTIPQRMSSGGKTTLNIAKSGFAGIINEIYAIVQETFTAIADSFFKPDGKKTEVDEKLLGSVNSVKDHLEGGKVSDSSKEKIGAPVFKNRTRIAVHSKDRLTRDTLGESLTLPYNELSENNELYGEVVKSNRKRERIIQEMNTHKLSTASKYDVNPNLVSVDEMNKLALQMPNRDLQRKYAKELKSKNVIEVDIPSIMTSKKGIYLGESKLKDASNSIYMPVSNPDELYRAYTFIGGQGAGKDTAIKNWIIEACVKHGISSIVIEAIEEEGKRGMADGIRDSLPPEKIIDLNLGNGDWIIPLDLTEIIKNLGRSGNSRFADEMIDFINLEGHTRSRKYLREAAKASGGSLYNIKRIIEDENFRKATIEKLKTQGDIRLAEALNSWGSNKELGSKVDAVLDRLDMFFGNDILFDIFAQPPKKEVNFAKWMSEGKAIIIRIPNRKLGTLATKTLVHWTVLKLFMTRMLMSNKEKENGCFFVFNEPEQYATDGLTNLMGRIGTEGRKERMGSLWAFHHWDKLSKELQRNLQGGGVQQFLFNNDHLKTFELSQHRFEDTIPLDQAVKLPQHHAIVSIRAGGELQPAFICKMRPPLETLYTDNKKLTLEHTKMYGRHWQEIQKM